MSSANGVIRADIRSVDSLLDVGERPSPNPSSSRTGAGHLVRTHRIGRRRKA